MGIKKSDFKKTATQGGGGQKSAKKCPVFFEQSPKELQYIKINKIDT